MSWFFPAAAATTMLSVVLCQTTTARAGGGEPVEYVLTLDATWSPETHPTDFPPSPHITGLVGGSHHSGLSIWEIGGLATPGIESMAESGAQFPLADEVDIHIEQGNAFETILGGGINEPPGSRSVSFNVTEEFDHVTLVAMLAPSPDWFVGVGGLDLRPNGEWINLMTMPAWPYDAGTDSGGSYTAPNDDTDPQEPISQITGFPFMNAPPLGTLTIRRVRGEDVNEDGIVDVLDLIQVLTYWGDCPACAEDTNHDGTVNVLDVLGILSEWG